MSAAAPLSPGEEIAPGYEVIDHLSRGRRLDVYDAWSAERGCRVVVKALRPERAGGERALQLLRREGELLARLTHPHLVRAYETLGDPPAIVLETLSGETLAHMAASGRQLSEPELAHLATHLGSAVRYLHANGVLHLDLKPANVVAEAGRAKLIDLSLARSPGPAVPGIGTPDYMAPEQARGGELTTAADVWGIGVVLYEMLTGEPAFALDDEESGEWTETDADGLDDEDAIAYGEDEAEDAYVQLRERAPRLAASPAAGDDRASMRVLIDDCLEPDPARRPAVEELLARAEAATGVAAEQRRWGGGAARRGRTPDSAFAEAGPG
jgi:serine/threonine protein kinase